MVVDPRKIIKEHTRTVVVSRNPFSRLYSAYVDKLYLPLFWEQFGSLAGSKVLPDMFYNTSKEFLKTAKGEIPTSGRIMKYRDKLMQSGLLVTRTVTVKVTPVCANNATFEQFLKFVINQTQKGLPLEPHWAPISHLCHPCKMNTFKIVKQESFAEDVEYALNSVGMNLSEFDWLKRSLREDRGNTSIPGIVAVVARMLSTKQVRLCISDKELALRLWKAFQIQGFISDHSHAPEVFQTDNFRFRAREMTQLILQTISKQPLTPSESIQQRANHLKAAYLQVSPSIINEIRKIYKLDFTLFDYSDRPPIQ